jgi:hypothetical protein
VTLIRRYDSGTTTGHLLYKTASGAGFNVTYQRMTRPIQIEAVGATDLVTWPSGSEVALVERIANAFHQIVLVRASGVMLNVTAFGLLGKHISPRVTMGELEAIMRSLDTDLLDATSEHQGD